MTLSQDVAALEYLETFLRVLRNALGCLETPLRVPQSATCCWVCKHESQDKPRYFRLVLMLQIPFYSIVGCLSSLQQKKLLYSLPVLKNQMKT